MSFCFHIAVILFSFSEKNRFFLVVFFSLRFDKIMKSLSSLTKGQVGRVISIGGSRETAARFMDMGIYINEKVQLLTRLLGGNLIILSRNGKYSFRRAEAGPILVEVLSEDSGL